MGGSYLRASGLYFFFPFAWLFSPHLQRSQNSVMLWAVKINKWWRFKKYSVVVESVHGSSLSATSNYLLVGEGVSNIQHALIDK